MTYKFLKKTIILIKIQVFNFCVCVHIPLDHGIQIEGLQFSLSLQTNTSGFLVRNQLCNFSDCNNQKVFVCLEL